ncbi:MAG: hypothetical protein AMXMBFR84_11720 [Candidatus Hydrogenedentota bacterium]
MPPKTARKPPYSNPDSALTPPLKWAGGKRWLLPFLKPLWQDFRNYRLVEPFCGGLAVALGLNPASALLNDINPHAINFYRQLQRGLSITIDVRNDETLYYLHRDAFNQLIERGNAETKEAAQYFYYLNRTGYNGLCRFNSRGLFNVPYGSYKTIGYAVDFSKYQSALSRWEFVCGDFESILPERKDFIYADPPYDVEFRHYSKEGFSWESQERLAEWLAQYKGPVIASNQATPRILKLYRRLGFKVVVKKAPRMISCTGDRKPAEEMLAMRGPGLL